MEQWREVRGFEGMYEVSDRGNVRTIPRKFAPYQKFMTQRYDKYGYKTVALTRDKIFLKKVHRLVAEVFIDNPDDLPQVNHLDGNKANNNLENLEWCTPMQNFDHAVRNGLKNMKKISSKPVSQYDLSGNYIGSYSSATEAARRTGMDNSTISYIARKRVKNPTTGYIWRYGDDPY